MWARSGRTTPVPPARGNNPAKGRQRTPRAPSGPRRTRLLRRAPPSPDQARAARRHAGSGTPTRRSGRRMTRDRGVSRKTARTDGPTAGARATRGRAPHRVQSGGRDAGTAVNVGAGWGAGMACPHRRGRVPVSAEGDRTSREAPCSNLSYAALPTPDERRQPVGGCRRGRRCAAPRQTDRVEGV